MSLFLTDERFLVPSFWHHSDPAVGSLSPSYPPYAPSSSPAAIDPHVILIHHDVSRFIMMATCMNPPVREKFSSQAAPEVLAALRQIAEAEGRQFQSILDEALRDYIDRRQKERPRRHVMSAFAASLDEFDALYRELAK